MRKTTSIFIFALLIFTLSCFITTYASDTSAKESLAVNEEILNLINQNRASNGLAPLFPDEHLTLVSDTRVHEITRSFSHTRPDGRRYSTAFADSHIEYQYCGEILAYGFQTPKQVVTAWMESPGHHDAILSSHYTHVGISHIIANNHLDYWAVEFLSR